MSACTWVQYEPAGGTNPYPGFIHSTVSGDDTNPPPVGPDRGQLSVPSGTRVDSLSQKVDVGADPPALVAWAPPPPTTIARVDFMLRFTVVERIAIRSSADPVVQDFLDLLSHADAVTLTDEHVVAGVGYLASMASPPLTRERAAAILTP